MDNINKNNNFPLRDLFFAFLVIILSMFLSEVIYSYRNNSPYVLLYYLNKSRAYALKSNLVKAYTYLGKEAKINFRHSLRQYPDLIFSNNYPNIDINGLRQNTSNSFLEYIVNLMPEEIVGTKEADMSRIFYDLGLLASKNKQFDFTEKFFQMAVYLEPELSHYHIELANYYLVMGDKDKANEAIEFCLKFTYPQKHCKEFMGDDIYFRSLQEIGFLEKGLEEYYNSR